MEEFINGLQWQDIVTALSIVFGLISLVAYLDQRKSNKVQKKYLEFVNRQLDRDITKEEVDQLIHKKTELRSEIEEKLPQIGRSVVLQDQAEFYQKGVYSNYRALEEVNKKIAEIDPTQIQEVNRELKDYILKELSPQFKREKLITQTRDRVLGLLALIIAVGAILPFGIDYYIQLVLGIVMLEEILKYMILNSNNEQEQEKIYSDAAKLIFFIGLGFVLFAVQFLIRDWSSSNGQFDLIKFIWGATAAFGLFLILFAKNLVKRARTKIENLIS